MINFPLTMRNKLALSLVVVLCTCRVRSTDILETLRRTCPYNDFCTVSRLKTFNSSLDTQPCCFDCFCDDHSVVYGDSCPDYSYDGGNSVNKQSIDYKLECKALYYKDVSNTEMLSDNYMHFLRFIDFCPPNFNGNEVVRAKCLGNYFNQAEYDDIVAVSNEKSVLFKNKFCARCHGEANITRWNPKILKCKDDLDKLQMPASKIRDYILQNCILTSSRPEGVPINSRTIDCRSFVSLCYNRQVDEETKEKCLTGTRMPVLSFKSFASVSLYKNVFCANCGRQILDVCQKIEVSRIKSVDGYAKDILLGFPDTSSPRTSACQEFEKYDNKKGECRRLYCPPFEVTSYGECVPIALQTSNFLLEVKLIYRPEDVTDVWNIMGTISSSYNETLEKYYLTSFEDEFQYPNCNIREITGHSYVDKTTKRFQFITVLIVYQVNQDCTLFYIGEKMKTVKVRNRIWLIHDKQVSTYGQITFFDELFEIVPTNYDKRHLFSTMPLQNYRVSSFFLCPYFVLNMDELGIGLRTQKVLVDMALTGIQELKLISNYTNGVYPLSENEVAICVGKHHSKSNAGITIFRTTYILISFVLYSII